MENFCQDSCHTSSSCKHGCQYHSLTFLRVSLEEATSVIKLVSAIFHFFHQSDSPQVIMKNYFIHLKSPFRS